MKLFICLSVVLSFLSAAVFPMQESKKIKHFVIAFYNVENLFDTIDDPGVNDSEFLPAAESKWNTGKYNTKLYNISKVISSLNNGSMPDVMGFCEVENRKVLEDLIKTGELNSFPYEIIHHDSPDTRGIDVAAIYRKDRFKLVYEKNIEVALDADKTEKTRDILYIKGVAGKKDTLHIFFNHWPSRRGGQKESEPKRIIAANTLKRATDSILKTNSTSKIILMGDFNDYPTDSSLAKTIGANQAKIQATSRFLNLLYNEHLNSQGTHYYNGEWGVLDNIIISGGVFERQGKNRLAKPSAFIFREDWLLYTDKKGNKMPSRSYTGNTFHENGYSDHLPVYLVLEK